MPEQVDGADLKSAAERRGGSTPPSGTKEREMNEKTVVELAKKAGLANEVFGVVVIREDAELEELMKFVKLVEKTLEGGV